MAFVSSPVVYPPNSSPPTIFETRKRSNVGPDPPAKKRLFKKDFVLSGLDQPKKKETILIEASKAVHVLLSKNPFVEDEDEDIEDATINPVVDEPPVNLPSLAPSISYRVCQLSNGKQRVLQRKESSKSISYEKLIAQRSTTKVGKATRSYYGIDIHQILKDASELNALKDAEKIAEAEAEPVLSSIEQPQGKKKQKYPLWTEKYRAKKFTDLVGDERTHRSVLRWLKSWDPIVFPGSAHPKQKQGIYEDNQERSHRKILMLTGPPGLGKTTLSHVCARQAGYEVVEINASDERSKDVVRGKIKDCVGTENVRGINTRIGEQTVRKAGRPVCVIVDEVDGVVSGSGGGGEGGFIKALIDLVLLDQRNTRTGTTDSTRRKKDDRFRLLRPMILICNDVYHPSLRPLRASGLAEIVHVKKPPLEKIVNRMKYVFEKESIPTDMDAVRRLCEATWGISSRSEKSSNSATGEGDVRGILVIGQWVASRLKAARTPTTECRRMTRQWLEENVLADLANGGSGARGIGRGGVKETVDRIFLEGGGFSKTTRTAKDDNIPSLSKDNHQARQSVVEQARAHSTNLLRSAIEQCGEHDRIVSDLFTQYPSCSFQDDTFLSKPNITYDWLHFHDCISSRVYSQQEWELGPYLSQAALSFHHLFASAKNTYWTSKEIEKDQEDEPILPFAGPRADYTYYETHKANQSHLHTLHNSLSTPLYRTFKSSSDLSTNLIPYLNILLSPDIKPILISNSNNSNNNNNNASGYGSGSTATIRRATDRDKAHRAAEAMSATGISFERVRIEDESPNIRSGYGGFIYRMEPPIDTLATYTTASKPTTAIPAQSQSQSQSTRYAVRQVLTQELSLLRAKQAAASRLARLGGGGGGYSDVITDEMPDRFPAAVRAQAPSTIATTNTHTNVVHAVKRDFFGREILNHASVHASASGSSNSCGGGKSSGGGGSGGGDGKPKVWVTFHEGFSNAVRKPIGMRELMDGFSL